MFPIMQVEDEEYVLRPMNCPHHMVMYKSQLHSYKELPLRIAEIAADFRFEASGALTGIERTRAFYQNDSHIFCTPAQIGDVFKEVKPSSIKDMGKIMKEVTSKAQGRADMSNVSSLVKEKLSNL